MKSAAASICLVMLVSGAAIQAQTNTVRPGPEYDVLNAWAGDWVIQGETTATPSAPSYKFDWTLKGERILGGFFLQIHSMWKIQGTIQNGLVVTGYDPAKKTCATHGFNDDGSWLVSTSTFISEKTCIENGSTYSPDGEVLRWRNTWNFSADGKSFSVRMESEKDGIWRILHEAKGVRVSEK